VNFKIKGLDELSKRLTKLSQVSEIPLTTILSPQFISSCSRFKNAQELFDANGFPVNTAEDLKAIPDAEWDAYIRKNTNYPDWASLYKSAGDEWVAG
jgi:hypothetical protein